MKWFSKKINKKRRRKRPSYLNNASTPSRAYRTDGPVYIEDMSPEELEARVFIDDDLCTLDEEHFFIHGCLEIPIIGEEEMFTYNVWVSLSETNFKRTIDLWEDEDRAQKSDPMFGWLSTSLPGYPDTVNLKTNVHTRDVLTKPFIELEPTDHPLAVEQRNGITVDRIYEIHNLVQERMK